MDQKPAGGLNCASLPPHIRELLRHNLPEEFSLENALQITHAYE